jgi:hypothetical protein
MMSAMGQGRRCRQWRCAEYVRCSPRATVPAVQEESDVLRSVGVQPCIRPVFALRLAPSRCSRCGRWP